MTTWRSGSPEATRELGRELAGRLTPDGTLLLYAPLAAGKTVLAQGVAAGLGIEPREVQSPTFTLVREHRGPGGQLVHVDLYRLSADEALAAGLEDVLAGAGVKVVEWAERLPFAVPDAVALEISILPDGEREIRERRGGEHPRR
ncbi:MAG TPA: tRNA (adenosine(37)-N6)-threonylcarbamoyltransferase complex ATPase subunit type 1 TsaE [Thermoanaerobaculia bacterium]|nr:tRNA (adenosine(37)-N6)-threonylcarbamoyltransferase complex ATPase subunit type 1 TsaE [Thermoanaerobaculia bacterium]